MHRGAKISTLGLVVAALAAGCGSGDSGTSTIALKSVAVAPNGAIRHNFDCGRGSLWLPLEWKSLPTDTKELAVFISRYRFEAKRGKREVVVPFGDLISRIKPSTHHVVANVLPQGASWSAFGQVSCPPVREGQHIVLELFALNHVRYRDLGPRLATRLTEEALAARGESDEKKRSSGLLMEDAVGVGRILATYAP